jgi:hypothetical protein
MFNFTFINKYFLFDNLISLFGLQSFLGSIIWWFYLIFKWNFLNLLFTFNWNLFITFLCLFWFFRNILCNFFSFFYDWFWWFLFEIWPFINRYRNVMYAVNCYGFCFLVYLECLVSYFDLFFQIFYDLLAINSLV